MGFVYYPRESQSIINEMETNLRSTKEILDDLQRASRQLVGALDGGSLSGAAYNAGRGMFSELVLPTIAKASDIIADIEGQIGRYKMADVAAGDERLHEEELNKELEALKRQQTTVLDRIDELIWLQRKQRVDDVYGLGAMYARQERQLHHYMQTVEEDIRKVNEKLKRLHDFDMAVSGLFTEVLSELSKIFVITNTFPLVTFDENGGYTFKNLGGLIDAFGEGVLDPQAWLIEVISNGLEKPKNMTNEEWNAFGVALGARIDQTNVLIPSWIGRAFMGAPNNTTNTIKYAAKGVGKAFIGFDAWNNFNEYNDEYHNIGRGVAYSGVVTSVGFGAGAVGGATGASIAGYFGVTSLAFTVGAPILGAIIVGSVAVVAVKAAYDYVPWFRDGIDLVGDGFNFIGESIGAGVSGSVHSIKGGFTC